MTGPYEIFFPPLGTSLRFKVMPAGQAFEFTIDNEDDTPVDYRIKVLSTFIYNFKTEVVPQIAAEIDENHKQAVLDDLYRACVSLNPAIDIGEWQTIVHSTNAYAEQPAESQTSNKPKRRRQTKAQRAKEIASKHVNLETFLKQRVIGQDEAVDTIVSTMKREFAGLSDGNRPVGVFLFAGASGIGKTLLAEKLHEYLVDGQYDLVRIDCGEYQHKHENQKLTGSPPGYTGHEEGGQLTNRIINNPECVVLLDEIEKAHPDILNTFLRVFDNGVMTDSQGRKAMFNKAIIIMTTNLGNGKIAGDMMSRGFGFGQKLTKDISDAALPARESIVRHTEQEIREHFTPELLNRVDKVVVFNHLKHEDFEQIAEAELVKLNDKLEKQGYRLVWGNNVVAEMVSIAANPVFGARGLARIRRQKIEDTLAALLLDNTYPKGTTFQVVHENGDFCVTTQKPTKKVNDGTASEQD